MRARATTFGATGVPGGKARRAITTPSSACRRITGAISIGLSMRVSSGLRRILPAAPAVDEVEASRRELGAMLFFDPRMSSSGLFSCQSCHNVGMGGVDALPTSIGHGWQRGPRNAPTVYNALFNAAQFWDGRAADLAEQAQEFAARSDKVECEVLDDAAMDALGMGSLLALARGSASRPRLVVLKYNNGGDAKPYVLVGKGITFDTGGVNLKTQGGIEEMKYDMCGAASVLGTFVAAVGMQLPVNLVVIAAAVENAIDGNAYRPSDVITSMSGKTIEVGNTDAEGRLILCDALTYAQRFEPAALVDVATLTGAMMVALGKFATGVMTKKDDDLARELIAAGETAFDRAWQLPLWDEYQGMLDSAFADVYNIGGRWAGAITAGCFLSRFTEGQRWAHLDIAGMSWADADAPYRPKGATGYGVRLLAEFVAAYAPAADD